MMLRLNGPLKRNIEDTDLSDIATFNITGTPYWHATELDVLIIPCDNEPTAEQLVRIIERLTSESSIEEELFQQASQALQANRDFLALASPTNVQIVGQVRFLTKQLNTVIRLLLKKLDGTD